MSHAARPGRAAGPGPGGVLEVLLDGEPRTRADLADLTGLSRSTVASRVDELLRRGLVQPAGSARSSGGRPPARLAFNPRAKVVVGIDLGATHATVAVCDLTGTVLAAGTRDVDIARGPAAVLPLATDLAVTLLDELRRARTDVAAIGVGVPGPVEHATGRPIAPPIMPGWDRVDVPGAIRDALDAPVLVDNDVNVLALGEHSQFWPQVDDLIYVKVATGIGAGIIAGGLLQRGARGSAGDLGHVMVPRLFDAGPRDGFHDGAADLEAVASGPVLASALTGAGVEARTGAEVVAAANTGRREAVSLVRQAGRDLGAVLAGVISLLGPAVVVLGGSVARGAEHLLAGVREIVYRQSLPLATQHLQIVPARGDENAGAAGAAIMAAQHALSPGRLAVFSERDSVADGGTAPGA